MSDYKAPFMKIKDACVETGISQYRLRALCKSGFAPHIRSGTVYLIDVPRLLEKLREAPTLEIDSSIERLGVPSQSQDDIAKERSI